jgi:RNA polymerase sigma factor (TIGR02999 family)
VDELTVLPTQSVTQWLLKWREGDESALAELTQMVYRDLRRLAESYLRKERAGHTLQPTALVHEAYLQIQDLQHIDWKNRSQFIAVIAQVMRHVLVDYAREHAAKKRCGDAVKLPVSRAKGALIGSDMDLLELNEALEKLALNSPRKARVVELFYFGGLTAKEIAEVLSAEERSVSQRTVENDLKIARARLHSLLSGRQERPQA